MRIQPTSVCFIGWLSILMAVMEAIYFDQARQNPAMCESLRFPLKTGLMVGTANVAALLLNGILLLRGFRWSAYFHLVCVATTAGVLYAVWNLLVISLVMVGFLLLFALILFTAKPSAYFRDEFPPTI
jgi:hypothetical protein